MQIIISSKDLELTPDINEYIETRFGHLEKFLKHFDNKGALELKVEIARTTKHHLKGAVYYAEADLALPKSVLRAETTHEDLRSAIDEIHEDLERQVEKYRDSRLTNIRRGAQFIKRLFRGEK